MIASLPMYARASNKAAHDALWALIRDGLFSRGVDAPDQLDHEIDHWDSWGRSDLVLGQICNLPLRTHFAGKVTTIGTADYGLEGCPDGHYRSHFVVHKDNVATSPDVLFDARFAFNVHNSQSGYGAAQVWAAQRGNTFANGQMTGSHRASIDAVANRDADIATIDAQSWWIERGENPATRQLKVIGHTAATPGMTFITGLGNDPVPYFAAIQDAIAQMDAQNALRLGLKAIVALPKSAYDLPFPPELAEIDA